MLAELIVPVDGSATAARALPFAAELARRAGGRVELVHIDGESGAAVLDGALAQVRPLGVPAAAHLRTAPAEQEPADAILAAARELGAGLLVMSTRGRGGLARAILGSVADRVLRLTEYPILLVPPTTASTWPSTGQARILVALDGSPLAEQVVTPAGELATALRAEVVLASVVVPPPPGYGYFEEPSSGPFGYDAAPALSAARRYLEDVADRLAPTGLTVRVRTEVGGAAATLARLAADERAWVIALATHGHGGLTRLVLGSVAAELVERAAAPLLIVRGSAASSSEEAPA